MRTPVVSVGGGTASSLDLILAWVGCGLFRFGLLVQSILPFGPFCKLSE